MVRKSPATELVLVKIRMQIPAKAALRISARFEIKPVTNPPIEVPIMVIIAINHNDPGGAVSFSIKDEVS